VHEREERCEGKQREDPDGGVSEARRGFRCAERLGEHAPGVRGHTIRADEDAKEWSGRR